MADEVNKVPCRECEVAILIATAAENEGYCVPCYRSVPFDQKSRSVEEDKNIELKHGNWMELSSCPGFCVDLTSWEVGITYDGKIHQTVHVYGLGKEEKTEIFEDVIGVLELAAIRDLVSMADFSSAAKACGSMIVCDASRQGIRVLRDGITYECSDSLYAIDHDLNEGEIQAGASLKSVIALWEAVANLLPFHR